VQTRRGDPQNVDYSYPQDLLGMGGVRRIDMLTHEYVGEGWGE
jgi:hypothetical protein